MTAIDSMYILTTSMNSEIKRVIPGKNVVNILIVDDLKVNFLLIKAMLGKLNAQLFYADNGFKAVEHIVEGKPTDLVLMDYNMPGIDGLEASKKIKRLCPDLPIVSLSTFTESPHFDRTNAPYDAYITKPVDPNTLIETIDRLIQQSQIQES